MMKLTVRLAAAALCLFLALCAYWAANTPEQDQNRGLYAPNALHKVAFPCPPPCDEQMMEAIVRDVDKGNLVTVKREVGPGVMRRMYHHYSGIN